MVNKSDIGTPVKEAFSLWVAAGQAILDGLSSIYPPLLKGGASELPADVIRRFLAGAQGEESLKDFRNYSIRLLQKLEPEAMPKADRVNPARADTALPPYRPNGQPNPLARYASPTIPQALQTMIQEVASAIQVLSEGSAREKPKALQLAFEKIRSAVDRLVAPVADKGSSDSLPKERERIAMPANVSKAAPKESFHPKIPLPARSEKPLEGRTTVQPAERKEPEKAQTTPQVVPRSRSPLETPPLLQPKNSGAHPPQIAAPNATPQERTTIPAAPYSMPVPLTDLRRARKKRKAPWEREEYDPEQDPRESK